MWNAIKRGFGYGLGGRVGWELGGLLWKWVSRFAMLILLGLGAQCTLHSQKAEEAAKAAVEKPQHKQAKAKAVDTVPNPTAAAE